MLFDEYGIHDWPGETAAVDEFIADKPGIGSGLSNGRMLQRRGLSSHSDRLFRECETRTQSPEAHSGTLRRVIRIREVAQRIAQL